jgi:phenylacetate-CoA ligase
LQAVKKIVDDIYRTSPLWLQKLGITAFGWYWAHRRLGADFERFSSEYQDRESYSRVRFRAYVEEQLRSQVQRAYREVPYYRDSFERNGIAEKAINQFTLEDLSSLPRLEKSALRANPQMLLTARAARHPPKYFETSGTTGTPLHIYWDSRVHQHNIAARAARSFHWAGVSYREPRAVLAGRMITDPSLGRPPFWRYNLWEKQLYLSSYNITLENIPDYVSALHRFRPVTLTGFPSSLYYLATLIEQSRLVAHRPRAVISTSEALQPHMREVIERVFQVRTFQEYGSVENCALATECEQGRLHVHPDFGFVELLNDDGTPALPGESGEIVATGFANVDQIFIRYRTGDIARWASEPCPCGRANFPVLEELVGRQEDIIYLPNGRGMMRVDYAFKGLSGISVGQVVQETLNHLVINVVPSQQFTPNEMEAIVQRIVSTYGLGRDVNIEVRLVENIPREKNGKFRPVISRVSQDQTLEIAEVK